MKEKNDLQFIANRMETLVLIQLVYLCSRRPVHFGNEYFMMCWVTL